MKGCISCSFVLGNRLWIHAVKQLRKDAELFLYAVKSMVFIDTKIQVMLKYTLADYSITGVILTCLN